uniref:Putative HNH endonuclease n=1 Tax=viral metagenome TaxID=1070528 RepID=A0A6M3JJ10_9ZZZZ
MNRRALSQKKYKATIKGQITEKKYKYSKTGRATKKRGRKNYYKNSRRKVLEKLGNQCVKCGFADIRALQIDHINGGGAKELKNMSINSFLKGVLLDNGSKYQLLCANCNWIKRHENNEYSKGRGRW